MRQSSLVIDEGREDVDTIASSLEQIRAAVGEASDRAEEIFEGADLQTARHAAHGRRRWTSCRGVAARNSTAIDAVAATTRDQVEVMAQQRRLDAAL